jgi:heterodisulfide reductase subunit A
LNIQLLTLSEIESVQGREGNFRVTVRQHPRYIDVDKCIACGECAAKCPRKVRDEFNQGLNNRRAAYIMYGQSVPLKYAIDPDNCLYLTRGKCRACEKFCPTGAIRFDDTEKTHSLKVGAMILAPGFKTFDPSGIDLYGHGAFPDVVTGLEYERLLSSSGPCMGHLQRPSDNREPRRIAWLQCVGSRSTNRSDNGYCSSVCCMFAIKQAMVTSEHMKGERPEQTVFFMDVRTHGKGFERYYDSAREQGIRFVRARPHSIFPGEGGSGVVLQYVTEEGSSRSEEYDLLVLSTGLEAPQDCRELAEVTGIELDRYNFARTGSFDPVASSVPGIYVTGAFQGPRDIPQAVTDASSAAASAASRLIEARNSQTQEKTYPPERAIEAEEPRIGVFICSCGINISGVIDVSSAAEYARGLPNVVFVENNMFTCSADTQELIAEKIKEHGLNRIVIAACTPRTHEPLFQDTLKGAGLNAYLLEMANIRNHNSWVHQKEPEKATAKAKDQIRMAVAKAGRNDPLEQLSVGVNRQALVVGGGLAGMVAALGLADQGYRTTLVESSDSLGGNARNLGRTAGGEEIGPFLERCISRVESHEHIDVLKNARLASAEGSVGNFSSEVEAGGHRRTVNYGVAVVATGAREHKPQEYLYGEDQRVLTHLELDARLSRDASLPGKASSVVFIQCVGSREPQRPYCSRICCTHTVQRAIELKEANPGLNVYVLYRDIRTYGRKEELYTRARGLGVVFIRYEHADKPGVFTENGELYVEATDPLLQRKLQIRTDWLVLASAVVPGENRELTELYKCGVNGDGFLNEAHPKLRPVDMSVEGLFFAGLCHYPKPVDETVAQAKAVASRAGVILARDRMLLDAVKSQVTENCDGCALCLDVCPYDAVSLQDYTGEDGRSHRRVAVDKALCKGCGLCESTCPKEGIFVHGFRNDQLRAQVDAILQDRR